MFYRIQDNRLYDYAEYKYSEDCLETDIITQEELRQHPNKVIVQDGIIVLNPNYIEEEQEKEKQRLASLYLTRGDVFDALIRARGMDESVVMAKIEQMPEETEEQILNKKLSKNACQNALNFHRSHPMVDYIGNELNISSYNLDMFFDTNDYHYLLADMEGNG